MRPLSAGGMGAVYQVEQLSTGKPRALKLMHRELVFDPASRQHFEQEARVGARIASEHVVEVVAAGVDPQTQLPFLVMELLEGEDMATRLARGPFSLLETAAIFEQLCHAVGAAHDAGVIHRDLKPENIFLGVSRRTGMQLMVKVLDFGIAKVTEGQTRTTAAFGTPLWLAPEQTERGVITPAADVWALGLIAFAMLTGHLFWRSGEGPDASVTQLIREIVFDPIPPASTRAAERGTAPPRGFDAWFARCVVRDPRARFPNARAAYQALLPVLRGGAPVAIMPSGVTLVQGDGQYAPTADAVPAIVATKPSAGQLARVATAPRFLPPTAQVTGVPVTKPASGSAGWAVAAFAILLLVAGGAAMVFYMRAKLEGARVAMGSDAETPGASASVPLPPPTPSFDVPTTPNVPDMSSFFDAGGAIMPHGGGLHFGGMVQCSDSTLRDDAENQFNDKLVAKFDACLAAHPPSEASGGLPLVAHVRNDGSVNDVEAMYVVTGPLVTCAKGVLKTAHFAAPKKATDLTFTLFWMKS